MRATVAAIEAEFGRYKKLAEDAMAQVPESDLAAAGPGGTNSIAIIVWHVAGNLRSRFTEFLTSDGEKPWRRRDEEFQPRAVTREQLLVRWQDGWDVLAAALAGLQDADLDREVTIRRQPLAVREALVRALAHVASHAGQIVLIARAIRGAEWRYLSIMPGQSDAYLAAPSLDRPPAGLLSPRDDRR